MSNGMKRNHLVYGLVENADIRYVGYTTRLRQRRMVHARRYPGGRMVTLGAYSTRQYGLKQERRWIKRLFELGHPLTNKSEGGDGSLPGRRVSYLTRARLSAKSSGRRHSSEARAKMSAAHKGKHRSPRSLLVRTKIANGLKGRRRPTETRAKLSAAMKGRPWSPTRRAAYNPVKSAMANKGRHHSSGARANMSAAAKRRYASRNVGLCIGWQNESETPMA